MKNKEYEVIADRIYVYTRHDVLCKLVKGDKVLKIKNNLEDMIKLRHMFRVEGTGTEVNIDPSLMINLKELN